MKRFPLHALHIWQQQRSGKKHYMLIGAWEKLNFLKFYTYQHLFRAQLSSAWKMFHNLGTRITINIFTIVEFRHDLTPILRTLWKNILILRKLVLYKSRMISKYKIIYRKLIIWKTYHRGSVSGEQWIIRNRKMLTDLCEQKQSSVCRHSMTLHCLEALKISIWEPKYIWL